MANESRVLAIIKDEAQAVKAKYSDERRTEIAAVTGEVDIEDLIPREECVLTMTNFGYLKRQKMDAYHTQRRGGRGVSSMKRREEDVVREDVCSQQPRLCTLLHQFRQSVSAQVLRNSGRFSNQ